MTWRPLKKDEDPFADSGSDVIAQLAFEAYIEKAYTIVHCEYKAPKMYMNGGWINIWPSTYLWERDSDDHLRLLHAFNIPIAPEYHQFNKVGDIKRFTLIFPAIPKHWDRFSLKEIAGGHDGFHVFDIQRNTTGVYQIALR